MPHSKTILIAEDDALLRLVAVDVFEDAGYEVLEAANATEALFVLNKRSDVAALFTDVEMPGGINGFSLARQCRSMLPDISVVISSGHREPSRDDLPIAAKFIPKPYDPNAIVATINELIGCD